MLPRPILLTASALLFWPGALVAQRTSTLDLDLATPTLSRTVAPGTYQLLLKNRLPDVQYTVEVLQEPIPVPPLPKFPGAGEIPSLRALGDDCADQLDEFGEALKAAKRETELPVLLAEWNTTRDEECREEGADLFRQLTTTELSGSYGLDQNQRLLITVERKSVGGTAEWEFVVSTQPRGEWRTVYGFTFVPDNDQRFFAEQVEGDPTKFRITKERDNSEGLATQFLPSVLVIWSPRRYRNLDLSPSLAGGLGYNFDRLAALLGIALTYNENLTFTLGAAIHPQRRLVGQYRHGDIVNTNLTANQLHEDKYLPNIYFGIALRLDSDPFERRTEPQRDGGSKPADTPANAATPESTPASDPVFVAGSLSDGSTKIGAFSAEVEIGDDSVIVQFDTTFTDVAGTYLKPAAETQNPPCIAPTADARKTLPRPKEDEVEQICFAREAVSEFDGVDDGGAVTVTFDQLRIAVPVSDAKGSVYRANLKSVTKP